MTKVDPVQALSESERRFNAALLAGRQGVWDHNLVTDEIYYSPTWWHMRGYTPEADLDNSLEGWLLRVHPDDRARIRDQIGKHSTGVLGHNTMEYRERHKDGHYIWIQSRGLPIERDADGNAMRSIGTDTDITAQKELEAALASEKERLRVLLHSIADAVVATDQHGQVTYLNPSAERLLLCREEDVHGRHLSGALTLLQGDTRAVDPLRECLLSDHTWENSNLSLRIGRGQLLDVRVVASLLRNALGMVDGFVVVLQDVSARRRLEKRLAFLANHDELTRLPNRRALDERLERAILLAEPDDVTYALCFIDLDHFKQINDRAGHMAGDLVLQQVALAINCWKTSEDFAARMGGDEFVVLMQDKSAQEAETRMTELADAVCKLNFAFGGESFNLGMSYGIALINAVTEEAAQVLQLADKRCYAHKQRKKAAPENKRAAS